VACHVGPNFSDERLHNTGVAWRDGKFADLGGGQGNFKTPTLREVSRSAPYMHDGSIARLEDVMEYYDRDGNRNPGLDPEISCAAPFRFREAKFVGVLTFSASSVAFRLWLVIGLLSSAGCRHTNSFLPRA